MSTAAISLRVLGASRICGVHRPSRICHVQPEFTILAGLVTALRNILVFASLEVGSLFLLHYFLKRKFAFSPLYQLAFALETEMYLVQGSLFLEIVVLLQYELVHFGKQPFEIGLLVVRL